MFRDIPHCGLPEDHEQHPMTDALLNTVTCVGKLEALLTTEQKVDELYRFVILELKPLLTALAENPMSLMTGGMPGMPQMPPPPLRRGR